MTERRSITGLALSWSHVVITLVVWVLTIGIAYQGLRGNTAENTRRIQGLEEKSVDRREYDDLKARMSRIEEKLDRALRH